MTSRIIKLTFPGLALVSVLALTACASTSSHVSTTNTSGPQVADNARYNPGNLKSYTVRGRTYYPKIPESGYEETGLASWYGAESGNRTAMGEPFDPDGISAAHKTFPLPSVAEVTNLENGKTVRVRINDRGPFAEGRIIDLSRGAAHALGIKSTTKVRVVWLGPVDNKTPIPNRTATTHTPVTTGYIVQLGAFSDKDNAERAQDRIEDSQIDRRNGLYVVYLGPYDGVADAETHRQQAIDAGFTGAILKRAD